MSSTYTGNPTATQAPSSPPGPGVAPEETLPSDGDADNAASVAQAFKVCADFIAWLTDKMMPSGAAFVQKLDRWRSMRGHTRAIIDHWGKPGGSLYSWVEQWVPGTPFDLSGIQNAAINRWHLVSNAAGCGFSSFSPGVAAGENASNTSRSMIVGVDGTGSGNHSEVRLNDDSTTSLFTDDALISVEWEIDTYVVLNMNWVVGFAGSGELVNAINNGLFFINAAGAANWHARTIVGGVNTDVDTGVSGAANTPHTFAIHWVGANVDDLSVRRVLFFIDGVQVANITTTLPNDIEARPLFGGTTTAAIANPVMLCGPVRYSQITAISTP